MLAARHFFFFVTAFSPTSCICGSTGGSPFLDSLDFVWFVVPVENPNQPENFICCGSDSDKLWIFERILEIFPGWPPC